MSDVPAATRARWPGWLAVVIFACGGSPSRPRALERAADPVVPGLPVVALDDLEDGDAELTADASCRMIDALHAFGDAKVTHCGWRDGNTAPDPATGHPAVTADRACLKQALAAHASFVLVWRSGRADPVCNELALWHNDPDTHCGYIQNIHTVALVGLRKATGYATYEVDSDVEDNQDDWSGSEESPVVHTSRTSVRRCVKLELDDRCEDSWLPSCFSCDRPDGEGKDGTIMQCGKDE